MQWPKNSGTPVGIPAPAPFGLGVGALAEGPGRPRKRAAPGGLALRSFPSLYRCLTLLGNPTFTAIGNHEGIE